MSTAAPLQSTAAKSLFVSKASHAGLLLQRKCACGGPASSSLSGECEECNSKRLQKKLSIGASNDSLEQEADRVADQVMAAPAHSAVSGVTPRIQRFTGQSMGQADIAPASVDRVLASSGRPLEPALQQDMGQRFGHDFSQVRVHTGAAAEQSARDVNAVAYTVGCNIMFGTDRFAPGTKKGLRLIAHELTHVVQQSSLARAPVSLQRFAEGEHKSIGDVATGQRTIFLAPDMPVTFGDIVALGGDLFGDWSTIVRLAHTPGITKGTRGEVWYAILVKVRASLAGKSEKEAEAEWLGIAFDEKAKAAVEARYGTLAVGNISHFANPREGDAARSQALKDAGPSAIGAGATYRSNHATALMMGAAIGATQRTRKLRADRLNDALIIEAFASHFLTDAFSAGHQQTERASVKEYWDRQVPHFWTNFQQWLAARVTLQLKKRLLGFLLDPPQWSLLDPQWVTEQFALPSVVKAMASLPRLGFGDLMSGAIHDYFNKYGAQANVAGRRITLVGDSLLLTKAVPKSPIFDERLRHVTAESKDTFDAATAAVKAGIEEIYQAAALGREGEDPERVPDKILKAGGGLFAAEQLMPTLTPDVTVADQRQRSIAWKLRSVKDVFDDPRLAEGLEITVDKYAKQVSSLSGLSEEEKEAVNVLLVFRMKGGQNEVIKLIKEVIEYTPIQTDVGFNPRLLQDLGEFRRQIGEGAFH